MDTRGSNGSHVKRCLVLVLACCLAVFASTYGCGSSDPDEKLGESVVEVSPEGPADLGPADTGPQDTGPADTGPLDTGPADTGPLDTGPQDQGSPDAEPEDFTPGDPGPPGKTLKYMTYNLGLAHGAVALAPERLPHLIDHLKKVDADVACLQEVWSDADSSAVIKGLRSQYPFSFREKTVDTSPKEIKCKNATDVLVLQGCVEGKCFAKGISVFECVATVCKAQYDKLDDDCKRCLAANTTNPGLCFIGGAQAFGNEGRNGLILLSRYPLGSPKYTAYDTLLIKRGVLTATVGSKTVQCTHFSADLDAVPYPSGRQFKNWIDEQKGQFIAAMGAVSGSGCRVLMGDLNAGAAVAGLTAELADNFKAIADFGFVEPWKSPVCTWCKENVLAGSKHDSWIDHVMFYQCGKDTTYKYSRAFDQEITVKSKGKDIKTRLSDHYGLLVEVTDK